MKRLLLPVVLAALLAATGCNDAGNPPVAKTSAADCGHLDQRRTAGPDLTDPAAPPKQIACMRQALALHRSAIVILTSMGTDSGPYDNTYRLDPSGHVSLAVRISKGGRSMGDQPYQVACTKPDWLPGAVCPPPPPPKTRPVPFTVAPGQHVTARTRYVDVLVHPTHCTGGRSGVVLAPAVERSYGQIRVLFRVSNRPNHVGHCGDVSGVRYRLDLRAPLGDRWIVDSSCIMPSVYWREVCQKTKVRARAS